MIWGERALCALVAAAVAACWQFERGSALAAAIRDGKPWGVSLELAPSGQAPRSYLALYHPVARTVDLLYRGEKQPVPSRLAELVRGSYAADMGRPAGADPALDASDWLERVPDHGARMQEREGQLAAADRWLAWLESRKLARGGLRSAWLPAGAAGEGFVERLLDGDDAPRPEAVTAEVLNATGRTGVAWDATRVLRARGADVINTGNHGEGLGRTVLYDRTGRIENAFALQAMLNCATARSVTRVDESRLVDVSVVLDEDCARSLGDKNNGNGTR